MEFVYQGQQYRIEFSRKHKIVKTFREDGKQTEVKSKYPFTTAYLQRKINSETMNGWENVAEPATVGCIPTDKFTLESGRLKALKKLTARIAKELREPMWTSYHGRLTAVKEKKSSTPSSSNGATPVITPMMALDLETPVVSYLVN